jgi:carbamoyl-phosphate synthase small subunit
MNFERAALILRDGTIFRGALITPQLRLEAPPSGEVVFNTAMAGYEEIITDPSYHRQIVVLTQPEVGNYGITLDDEESFGGPKVAGLIMREYNAPSNHRAKLSLADYLARHNVPGLCGIDTRALTLHLREHGSQPGLIVREPFTAADAQAQAKTLPDMEGQDLAREVTTPETYEVGDRHAARHVVLIDYGAKQNIAQLLAMRDCRVSVVPCTLPAEEIRALAPDGILLSNGPGDPAATTQAIETVRGLVGRYPMFGICLGHQILGLALGAKTFKLKFGHRGGNQPVLDLRTRHIHITSQNHGFCVDPKTLPQGAEVTHVNLSDETLEGFALRKERLFAVQFHPEASPGPHDAAPLFDAFVRLMNEPSAAN